MIAPHSLSTIPAHGSLHGRLHRCGKGGSDHGRTGVRGRHTSIVHRSFPNDLKAKTFRPYYTVKSTSARLPSQGPHPQHAPLAMVPTAKSDTNADTYMTNARFKLAEKVPSHMQQSTDIITTTQTITSIRWRPVPCSRSTAIIVSAAVGGLHTVPVTARGQREHSDRWFCPVQYP